MVVKKKVKISNVKRSQHLKNKKTFNKSHKKQQQQLQQKKQQQIANGTTGAGHKTTSKKIFGKLSGDKRKSNKTSEQEFNGRVPKSSRPPKNDSNNNNNKKDDADGAGDDDDDDVYENIADMMDEEDVEMYINHAKRKTGVDGADANEANDGNTKTFEQEHARISRINREAKKRRVDLLPIKSKTGEIIERSEEVEDRIETSMENDEDADEEMEEEDEELLDSDDDVIKEKPILNATTKINGKAISMADLLILREQEVARQKYRIGIICSGILEKPEDKMKNFAALFELMDERTGETTNLISIRKIAALSLLEVFKDILPEYRIGQINLKSQTVKKNTMERVNYEDSLLLQYKKYLQRLEKATGILTRRSGGRKSIELIKFAEIAVDCLCDLLTEHSYFNFGQNVAQLLVYVINANNIRVRARVLKCFQDIFKEDKKLELTLFIIRRLNQLIKSKSNLVHVEVLSCLLALPIKSINLDAEKEAELKQKKLEAHKARLINMSKKEKKRRKRLAQLDKDLQETKAEENKQTKLYKLTEITKMVFTIFFRILKNDPSSKLLSITLEGLAKFAHIINLDFFSDLVEVLNGLMESDELGYREQLHCIQTVFTILSGQGEVLNIDPLRFYGHLYRNLLSVSAGKNHTDLLIILKTLNEVIVKRRKNITHQRMLAFIKRLLTLSLQLLHNGTLGCLGLTKTAIQLTSTLGIILDTDCSIGSGRYNAELDDPEYCNANCTSLYELGALGRHYHPIVRKLAKHLAAGVPATGEGTLSSEIGKLNPIELYEQFDTSEMAFNPPIPTPKPVQFKAIKGRHFFLSTDLEQHCRQALSCRLDGGTTSLLDFRT